MANFEFIDSPGFDNSFTNAGADDISNGSNFLFRYNPDVQPMSAFGIPTAYPLQMPLLSPIDPFVGSDFADQLFDQGFGLSVDMFGQAHYGSLADVDMMSGLPVSDFHPVQPHATTAFTGHTDSGDTTDNRSLDRMKLDRNDEIIAERDLAVEKYHSAMDRHDYDEALRWERMANSKQGELYNLWDTPTYGVSPKAPGL